jgi:hypothetical protein
MRDKRRLEHISDGTVSSNVPQNSVSDSSTYLKQSTILVKLKEPRGTNYIYSEQVCLFGNEHLLEFRQMHRLAKCCSAWENVPGGTVNPTIPYSFWKKTRGNAFLKACDFFESSFRNRIKN